MTAEPSRRRVLQLLSLAVPAAALTASTRVDAASTGVPLLYPTQPPELVQEMVVVAHFDVARVKELVTRQPTLAKATR